MEAKSALPLVPESLAVLPAKSPARSYCHQARRLETLAEVSILNMTGQFSRSR
ncbi:MAG: hypothetical protein ACD_75C01210G0001 [uncultured bacterium]|nr:MAG: hypothetical protein ACD_75C01210G0001 [uncultured bacterium]